MSRVKVNGMTVYPTLSNIIVSMSTPEKITQGGIIIPDTAQKQTDFKGTIAAVPKNETELKVGMTVIVAKRSGITTYTDDNSHTYKIYHKSEIKYIYA